VRIRLGSRSARPRRGEDLRPECSPRLLGFSLESREHAGSLLAAEWGQDQREDAVADHLSEELAQRTDELDEPDRARDCEPQDVVKRHRSLRRAS